MRPTYGKRLVAVTLVAAAPLLGASGGSPAPAAVQPEGGTARATVDLAAPVQRTEPSAIGVVSSTYGANPLSSPAQAAIEERLDARYVRLPVGYRDGRVTSSAAGGPRTLDVPALTRWYRAKGFTVLAVIGGRTNDVDVAPGDATRIIRALGTDGVAYSTPNEPTNQGWDLDRQIRAAEMIVAEGKAVTPDFTLWGPTWSHYSRATLEEYAEEMGPGRFGGVDYHHYAMGSTSLSTEQSLRETPGYGQEIREVRADLRSLGLPERVSVDELNYSWRYEDGTAPTGRNHRFFTAVNTVWMASALGHIVSNGGSGAVYATQNGPLGIMVQGGTDDQDRPAGSPMPAYWGIAAWTGATTFPHFKDTFYEVTSQSDPVVETFAVNNEAGGYNLVVVNKSETTGKVHRVSLRGVAGGTYDAYQTSPAAPYDAPRKVTVDAPFDGAVSVSLPAMSVTTLVLEPTPTAPAAASG